MIVKMWNYQIIYIDKRTKKEILYVKHRWGGHAEERNHARKHPTVQALVTQIEHMARRTRRKHACRVYALIMGARKLHPDDNAMHGLRSVVESALKYTIASYAYERSSAC
jgi:hypothetical protein